MIEVSIRLLPASGGSVRQIAMLEIVNDDTGTAERGNYDVYLWSQRRRGAAGAQARITNYDRSRGAVALVQAALEALGERTPQCAPERTTAPLANDSGE